ncbi:hypothetical protein Tco_1398189 [Tanacetum coccineum]
MMVPKPLLLPALVTKQTRSQETLMRRPDFILDKVFKNPTLTLPPPVPAETHEPQTAAETNKTLPDPTTEAKTQQDPPQYQKEEYEGTIDPQRTISPEYPKPQPLTPTTPKATPTETSIPTQAHEKPIEKDGPSAPKEPTPTETSTPPPVDEKLMEKNDLNNKPTKPLARKALFGKHPEADTTQMPKKQKHSP